MQLAIEQRHTRASTCLVLSGQLDAGTATGLAEQLCALRCADATVHIDLSQVEFIDGFGAGVLRAAVGDSLQHRWRLQIEPYMRRPVRRVLDQAGLAVPHPGRCTDSVGPGRR